MIEWIVAGWLTCMLPVKFAPDWVFIEPLEGFFLFDLEDYDFVRGVCVLFAPVLIWLWACWLGGILLGVIFVNFCRFLGR